MKSLIKGILAVALVWGMAFLLLPLQGGTAYADEGPDAEETAVLEAPPASDFETDGDSPATSQQESPSATAPLILLEQHPLVGIWTQDPVDVLPVTNPWKYVDSTWYYFDSDGLLATSQWVFWNNKWYYLADDGAMATGLLQLGSDCFWLDQDGSMRTGWYPNGDVWNYFGTGSSGKLLTSKWLLWNYKWYYLAEDGVMATGFIQLGNDWFWLGQDGAMRTGWYLNGDVWNYYDSGASGKMVKDNWAKSNGYWYYLDADGVMLACGWFEKNNKTFYINPSTGRMASGWLQLDSVWYYFGGADDGSMKTGKNVKTPGGWHPGRSDFDSDGHWLGYSSTGDVWLDVQLQQIMRACGYDLWHCFTFVASYSYVNMDLYPSGNWAVPYARQMIQQGAGNCYRFAALFDMLAWYLGYDCNAISGWISSYSLGQAPHGWVEIYIGGYTYVCDPDMYKFYPYYNWFLITYANAPIYYGR